MDLIDRYIAFDCMPNWRQSARHRELSLLFLNCIHVVVILMGQFAVVRGCSSS